MGHDGKLNYIFFSLSLSLSLSLLYPTLPPSSSHLPAAALAVDEGDEGGGAGGQALDAVDAWGGREGGREGERE